MVERIFTEKKEGISPEVKNVYNDLKEFLNIENLEDLRILNRYDVENIPSDVFEKAKTIVFSEPQVDILYEELPEIDEGTTIIGVETLPGQFDQRADSCAQCIQLLSGIERPLINYAKLYLLKGDLTSEEIEKIKSYLINPVETKEANLEKPDTLIRKFEVPNDIDTVEGFINLTEPELNELLESLGLAMDLEDLKFLQNYFKNDEERDPTLTEIRVIDTYWSDHCRHTTFGTHLKNIDIGNKEIKKAFDLYEDLREEVYSDNAQNRPKTLMDIATLGTKVLKRRDKLPELDESDEINACSIHIPTEVDGEVQDWIFMFKNETHNHPTEIEPFGGAATCIGGCIRDPLSGRTFVHQAMRVTGGADPRASFEETIPGRLPQRKIAQTAAAGYSSYGNQIGLATGHVAEIYHPGYAAKHLECGAVIGAAPAENIRREEPAPGDVVILLGGRTGRDGIGGATGSSKSHNMASLTTMASEVQKGNAPEERKIQRLFRNKEITNLIKRCNDFGAGGVAVAIGELADGLEIDLDAVRKKYEGMDGTELAISESQERMAVVVEEKDVDTFIKAAQEENLEAYPVAVVTEEPRMVMKWRDKVITNLSREFLNSNGAIKEADILIDENNSIPNLKEVRSLEEIAKDLKYASRRGLVERFDSTVGANSLFMPFGGKTQRTPEQVMAALLPVLPGQKTDQGSIMAYGFDSDWNLEENPVNPYYVAKWNILTSIAKLVAAGADYTKVYLTLQEFFEKLGKDPKRWAKPFAALLAALEVQVDLDIAAIGGKDSMSGSFLDLDVPPTVISFGIAPIKANELISSEFKQANNPVYLFGQSSNPEELKEIWSNYTELARNGKIKSAWALESGGIKEAVMKMSFGNNIGFKSIEDIDTLLENIYPGTIIAELSEDLNKDNIIKIGETTEEPIIEFKDDKAEISNLLDLNENVLEKVYPTKVTEEQDIPVINFNTQKKLKSSRKVETPKVTIPVFPGTNCEYDSANVCIEAGLEPNIVVIRNLSPETLSESADELEKSIRESDILFIPGGFSGGDEPEGSGKFIASFLRNPKIKDAIEDLLDNREGLVLGICNGFQALVKLGLVPYGKIIDTDDSSPTLTYNDIGRHQSSIVRTRVASDISPWLSKAKQGNIYNVPISHGEGRFIASPELLKTLEENGQIATQYVNLDDQPSMSTDFNPNGSIWAIEGITSPDGRVFGKMGHSERLRDNLYQNVPGNYEIDLFKAAKEYFE